MLLTVIFVFNANIANYLVKHKQSLNFDWKVIVEHRLSSSCSVFGHGLSN